MREGVDMMCDEMLNQRVERKPQTGFSLLETSLVLAVVALVSLGGLYTVNQKLENDAVEKSVVRLSAAIEKAYLCWDSEKCQHSNGSEYGWNPETTNYVSSFDADDKTVDYGFELGLKKEEHWQKYKVAVYLDDPDDNGIIYNLILTLQLGVPEKIALRIAGALGSTAEVKDHNSGNGEVAVVLKIGIPGTEFAFREFVNEAANLIGTKDLVFGSADPDDDNDVEPINILGLDDVGTKTVTFGRDDTELCPLGLSQSDCITEKGKRIDKKIAVAVDSLTGLGCPGGVTFKKGKFVCDDTFISPPPR